MSTHDELRTLADQVLRDVEQARIDSDARFKAMMGQCDKLLVMIDAVQAGVKALNAADGGWIPWAGGECPVDDHQLVTVRFRGGQTDRAPAGAFLWYHDDESWDIVAYKVEG